MSNWMDFTDIFFELTQIFLEHSWVYPNMLEYSLNGWTWALLDRLLNVMDISDEQTYKQLWICCCNCGYFRAKYLWKPIATNILHHLEYVGPWDVQFYSLYPLDIEEFLGRLVRPMLRQRWPEVTHCGYGTCSLVSPVWTTISTLLTWAHLCWVFSVEWHHMHNIPSMDTTTIYTIY